MHAASLKSARNRQRLIDVVLKPGGVSDIRVLNAMNAVPRELFVQEGLKEQAYTNYALPISHGQTISQPLTVGLMSQALSLTGKERVLEIGTGSGYQTAVLASLAAEVYSIERISPLAEKARLLLRKLGFRNITLRTGDGTIGWNEQAPFDAIMVTAGGPALSPLLLDQLRDPGIMVTPVGGEDAQDLLVIEKKHGVISQSTLGKVRFVKLLGTHGWQQGEGRKPALY